MIRPKAPRMAARLIDDVFDALDEQTVVVPGTGTLDIVIPSPAHSLGTVHEQRWATEAQINALLEANPHGQWCGAPPSPPRPIEALKETAGPASSSCRWSVPEKPPKSFRRRGGQQARDGGFGNGRAVVRKRLLIASAPGQGVAAPRTADDMPVPAICRTVVGISPMLRWSPTRRLGVVHRNRCAGPNIPRGSAHPERRLATDQGHGRAAFRLATRAPPDS